MGRPSKFVLGIALILCLSTPSLVLAQEKRGAKLVGGKSVDHWIALLASKDPYRRELALYRLMEAGVDGFKALPSLVALSKTKDSRTRERVAWALATKGPRVIPVLQEMLKDKDKHCRATAAATFTVMKNKPGAAVPSLIDACGDSEDSVRVMSWKALVSFGEVALPEILKSFQRDNARIRESMADAVRMMGPKAEAAVPFLMMNLKDKIPGVRASSAYALGSMGRKGLRAFASLVLIYENKKEEDLVRASAIYSLGQMGSASEKLKPYFLKSLADIKERAMVRGSLAQALGRLGVDDEDMVKKLLPYVTDQFEEVRFFTVLGIGKLGEKGSEALPALQKRYQDREESSRVRVEAVKTLSRFGVKAYPSLIDALAIEYQGVPYTAFRALCGHLIQHKAKLLPLLLKASTHKNPRVRKGVAMVFGETRLQEVAIIEALRGLTADRDHKVCEVAHKALRALGVEDK